MGEMQAMTPTPSSVARAREIVSEIADYLNDEAVIEFTNTVALALDAQREADAVIAENCRIGQWHEGGIDLVAITKQNVAQAIREGKE